MSMSAFFSLSTDLQMSSWVIGIAWLFETHKSDKYSKNLLNKDNKKFIILGKTQTKYADLRKYVVYVHKEFLSVITINWWASWYNAHKPTFTSNNRPKSTKNPLSRASRFSYSESHQRTAPHIHYLHWQLLGYSIT